jgi:putative membrane protein
MHRLRLATAALGLAALSACASPMHMTETSGPAASLSAADRTFISEAAYGGLGEVALGELAYRTGSDPGVRDFGQHMVQDHGQANERLINVSTAKGVAPPTKPDPGRMAVTEMLAKLSGDQFDQQYVAQQLADHEVSLTLYQAEANGGSDPDVKAFAQQAVPVIQRHIDMLKRLHVRTMSTTSS